MRYNFNFMLKKTLPKLAWIASIGKNSSEINVIHGSSVECRDNFMVEGIWDDEFEKGNFHKSENFFGSGIRIDNNKVYFSISSSPIDRLLFCENRGRYLFSNSLILLLRYTGAKLDTDHDYKRESLAVCISRKQYNREFVVIHPEINRFYQVFHENIIFNNGEITFEYRYQTHNFQSYRECFNFLKGTLNGFRMNYESDKRQTAVSSFSMLSQGYDSTAVSALVKNIGVKSAFIANRVRPTIPKITRDDEVESAKLIAKKLGYKTLLLNNKRSNITEDEIYFLATTFPKHFRGAWSELGFILMAEYIETNCSAAVVFSGHHGDSVWDANIPRKNMRELRVPSRPLGYCSEMRLKSGFINIPVPGILATDIKDIAKISHSPEMAPWRLGNTYDRPLPRRIAEEAGVDRHLFGMKKNFVASKYSLPINSNLRKLFVKYLRDEHHIHPVKIYLEQILNLALYFLHRDKTDKFRSYCLGKDVDLFFFLNIWATSKLSEENVIDNFQDFHAMNHLELAYSV